jgi:predicted transcriptional regulator
VRRPIELRTETWEKLDDLADATARTRSAPVSASQMAAAIIEQAVANLSK